MTLRSNLSLMNITLKMTLVFQILTRGDSSVDLEMMVQNVEFIRSLTEIEPWKLAIALEVDPRPNYTSDEEIRGQSIVLPMQ